MAGTIYRIVLPTYDNQNNLIGYATGANYVGCSPSNPSACDPKWLNTTDQINQYAAAKGETVVYASSQQEVWDIVSGKEVPSDWTTYLKYAGIAYLAWKILK